jgi:glutamate racemase
MIFSCKENSGQKIASPATNNEEHPIISSILEDEDSFYYVNFDDYPVMDKTLPIGVFDSGTGGLTVLDALVNFDKHNNETQEEGSDRKPDFQGEQFIYLADQANMPYGNYSSEEKSDLLVEHIIKDVQFLVSNKYYRQGSDSVYQEDKLPVKSIVIACNTATAYGSELVQEFFLKTGVELKVIGVIDAGARGTLSRLEKEEGASIGVMATVGTIQSKGYENTLLRIKDELGFTGDIHIFNQGGHGIAEAVDEEPDFIDRRLKEPREDYRGPGLDNPDFKIEKALLDIYNFNFEHDKMLCDAADGDDCAVLQINDAENYMRYHLVSLLEKIRITKNAPPLKALVLGCTHYPYLTDEIQTILAELYDYEKNGRYIYRQHMLEEVAVVDPAVNVAEELYDYLKQMSLFNPAGDINDSEFYISVPNPLNSNVQLDNKGRFSYKYKYGRNSGEIQEYVKVVPFSKENIPQETLERLQISIPETFELIRGFNQTNKKTDFISNDERI